MKYIDLRSDTVTRPSAGMRDVMAHAEVGDDVFGEDPTVNLLQERMADLFGKEAALFVPSGTMGNEICVAAHARKGDEIIVDRDSHIFVYETGGPAYLAGVQMMTVPATKGIFSTEQLEAAVRPPVYYLPKTTLLCLENTHGRTGGSVVPTGELRRMYQFAAGRGIAVHLDGARIWNAHVASGVPLREYGAVSDSLSVCFSKGLGAPVGSMILGTKEFITRALRMRKIFGGGMRQVGILAAAAVYALDNNIGRLADDHAKARAFSSAIAAVPGIAVSDAETNMVIADVSRTGKSQQEVLVLLREHGILMTPERQTSVRAVMHLDVAMEEVEQAAGVFRTVFR